MPLRSSVMLACLFASLARAAAGEEGGVLSENSFLDELPVVLSATRLRQPLRDTPAAVTLIDREMIRDAGARDVADLFRLVPGMYVAYNVDKEIVPGHVVSYHGLADPYAKRMQVQIDGRSVYTPLFGGPVWSSIPLVLDDIERIEVVRGPSAATYGANAFLGVINIVTRDPAEVRGRMLALSAGDAGGDAILRHGGRTDNADYRITLQLRRDKGYTDDAQGSYGGRPVFPRSDDKSIGNLAFRGDYRLTPQDELQVQFGYAGGTREAGDIPNNNPRREKDAASQYGLLRWQRALGPESRGGGFRRDAVSSSLYLGGGGFRVFSQRNLFANAEWRPDERWLFNLGAMIEHNSFVGTRTSPRLAVNHRLGARQTLRASVGRAYRNPVVYEQHGNSRWQYPVLAPSGPGLPGVLPLQYLLAPGDLRPERIDS
ncbi:MAG: TonB-dependent receptor, partial [Proteobacteria bacterium]|nr:TonB-dependent receptor [Pseudomonadota bacterium]